MARLEEAFSEDVAAALQRRSERYNLAQGIRSPVKPLNIMDAARVRSVDSDNVHRKFAEGIADVTVAAAEGSGAVMVLGGSGAVAEQVVGGIRVSTSGPTQTLRSNA